MRLLHLVHQYPPHYIGGTELYTQTLARYQALLGYSVVVFCPFPQSGSDRNAEFNVEQDVRIYRVPLEPRSRTQVFRDSFRQQRLKRALEDVLEKEEPDIVHIQHLMGMPMGLVDMVTDAGIPFVVTLHDYWYVCANAQLLTNTEQAICDGPDRFFANCAQCAFARSGRSDASWLAPSITPLMYYRNSRLRNILERAVRIIAPTQFVHRTYSELGTPTGKLLTVRHGLDLPQEKIYAARKIHTNRLRDTRLHIGYIGGISGQKGIHVLIEAVNRLPADQVLLTIYGDLSAFPEYVYHLRQIIKHPDITLAGPVSHDQIWMTLANFDVVVLPTLWYETSSLILDEAFAVGVPVIASRIGVMVEKIEEEVNGRLFPLGDVTALGQILLELIKNPDTLIHWKTGIPPVRSIAEHVRDIDAVYREAIVAI